MKPVRNLIDSLVERRLWPVALLLVAGIVAVPVLLAKGSSGGAAPSAAGAPSTAAVPSLATPGTDVVQSIGSGRGLRLLTRHNPFAQKHPKVKTASTTSTTSTTASGGGTSTTPVGSTSPSQVKPRTTYLTVTVNLWFGRIGHRKPHTNLPRLTALPSAANPAVIYLGVLENTKTAVFLISSDVHADGDGRCFPSARNCQTVHVPEGGTEFFDVFDATGKSTQYELDLTHVIFHVTSSKTDAAKAFLRAATSNAGATATRAAAATLNLRYDPSIGRLVPKKPAEPPAGVGGSGIPATTTPADTTTTATTTGGATTTPSASGGATTPPSP